MGSDGSTVVEAVGPVVEYERPPQPLGLMPSDPPNIPSNQRWNARKWEAWRMFHDSHTVAVVAEEMGLNMETLGVWRRSWRDRFGPEFGFVTARAQDAIGLANYLPYEPTTPREVAELASSDMSKIGIAGRHIVYKWLLAIRDDPDRNRTLTAAEIKLIDTISSKAEDRADEINRQHIADDTPTEPERKGTSVFASLEVQTSEVDLDDASAVMSNLLGALTAFKQDDGPDPPREAIEVGVTTENS